MIFIKIYFNFFYIWIVENINESVVALGVVGVFSGANNTQLAAFMMYLGIFGFNNMIFALMVFIL